MGRSPGCDENGLKKGPWTPEEDEKLVHYINKYGYGRWGVLSKCAGLNRCGKSCRLRWTNYLRPDIKRGKFSQEEEQTILNLHSVLGNKWSSIATHLPGRTNNEIKNFWNTHLRKKLIQMGFDPMTRQPRTEVDIAEGNIAMDSEVDIAEGNIAMDDRNVLRHLRNDNDISWVCKFCGLPFPWEVQTETFRHHLTRICESVPENVKEAVQRREVEATECSRSVNWEPENNDSNFEAETECSRSGNVPEQSHRSLLDACRNFILPMPNLSAVVKKLHQICNVLDVSVE